VHHRRSLADQKGTVSAGERHDDGEDADPNAAARGSWGLEGAEKKRTAMMLL